MTSPARSNLPSWQKLVNKRNEQLSSSPTPVQRDEPLLEHEEVSPKELELHKEYCPLFKRKSVIEYKPDEDDFAARIYGLHDNREAERRHSSTRNLDLNLSSSEVASVYHFDELIRE
ncbi:unnamed protein product [Cylindrotheca closterium]|uniref:Uncharacterized protein n=1 Tax=Cylindrotheca closterium TaxID=2856 RepID=A0AAD2JIE4_9STRA|nr:unnamed protein product [Cylindrotheca closterium]